MQIALKRESPEPARMVGEEWECSALMGDGFKHAFLH
jgi:hypothetical protein